MFLLWNTRCLGCFVFFFVVRCPTITQVLPAMLVISVMLLLSRALQISLASCRYDRGAQKNTDAKNGRESPEALEEGQSSARLRTFHHGRSTVSLKKAAKI